MTRWIRNPSFSTQLVVVAMAMLVPLMVLTLLFASDKQSIMLLPVAAAMLASFGSLSMIIWTTDARMNEMTATVRQNADNARLADTLARAACDQAKRGGAIVERAVAAIGAIDIASRKIADTISVIDDIAFQTNLLALNAAVEAARAGDQGRAFAVVASEVRSLAQRSASAAREIKALIHGSVGSVAEGSRLVSESGQHLGDIVASLKKVSDVVGENSHARQQQDASADEISRAVRNAGMVEQASAAAGQVSAAAAAATATISADGAQPPAALTERRSGSRPWSAHEAA